MIHDTSVGTEATMDGAVSRYTPRAGAAAGVQVVLR